MKSGHVAFVHGQPRLGGPASPASPGLRRLLYNPSEDQTNALQLHNCQYFALPVTENDS